MGFVAKPLGDCWGCDTTWIFDAATSKRLKAATWKPTPTTGPYSFEFLFRYVTDVTLKERDAILGDGWTLLFVDHVERPAWQATGAKGAARGLLAAQKAKALEYPEGATLTCDMEGVGDPGTNADLYVRDYAKPVNDAGYKLPMYEGYDDGFVNATRSALVLAGPVFGLWADYGARVALPGVGFFCKQFAQTTIAGVIVDSRSRLPGRARGRAHRDGARAGRQHRAGGAHRPLRAADRAEPPGVVMPKGFAAMSPEQQRAIAAQGGKAAHEQGRAHIFTTEEAIAAGKKGGAATSSNREHMAALGRKGGLARAEKDRKRRAAKAQGSEDA